MTDALFDAEPLREPAPVPAPPATDGQRRIARQRGVIAVGMHPLSLGPAPYLRVHPDAEREIGGAGPRCGTCRFRGTHNGGQRDWPKCLWPEPENWRKRPRVTNGPGTDCRASWPACTDYQPVEVAG
jgi:hypothetical protein